MNRVSIFASLVLLFVSSVGYGQINCYDSSLNLSGVSSVIDSLELKACELDGGMPEAVPSNFKVYSVVEYTLHKFKDPEGIERFKANTIDSLRSVSPFSFIFWWSPSEGDDLFGACDLDLSYPMDVDYQNCFTQVRSAIIESQLEQLMLRQIATGSFRGENYTALELDVLDLLNSKVETIQGCCASSSAKSENECTPCPVGQELIDLKELAYLWEVGTSIPVELPSDIPLTFQANMEAKSENGFLNLVGGNLKFGNIEIDLEVEYANFIGLGDSICSFPAYFTTDQTLCDLEIDNWDKGNRTIINIASTDDGLILEMSEYSEDNCYLFGDYIIDRFPGVFGGRYIDVPIDESMIIEGRGAIEDFPSEEARAKGLFAPSGAVVAITDPNSVSLQMTIWGLIARDGEYIPKNTLVTFTYDEIEYRYYSFPLNGVEPGYYNRAKMLAIIEKNGKLNDESLLSVERFDRDKPWAVVETNSNVIVAGFKDHGCDGVEKCTWRTTTSVGSLSTNSYKQVEIPSGTNCEPFGLVAEICCEAGRSYVNGNLRDSMPEVERQAILRIGADICEMGEALFEEYQNDVWGDLPDPLKLLYELKYKEYIVAGCDEGCYTDFQASMREFKARTLEKLAAVQNYSSWTKMKMVVSEFTDGEIAALSYGDRMHIIKTLAQFIREPYATDYFNPNNIPQSIYLTIYGTMSAGANERLIVRVLSEFIGDEKCDFVDSLFTDVEFADYLFEGFNEVEYFFVDDHYEKLVLALLDVFTDCKSEFEQYGHSSMSEQKIIYIGNSELKIDDDDTKYCEIIIKNKGDKEYDIRNPVLQLFEDPEIDTWEIWQCSYFDPSQHNTLKFTHSLDYIPVYISTDNYGGLPGLSKGLYLMPEFMLQFFADFQENAKIVSAINAAILAGSIVLIAPELAAASWILRAIAIADLTVTVGGAALGDYYASEDFKNSFEPPEDYAKFLADYRGYEASANAVVMGASLIDGMVTFARSANRLVRNSRPNGAPVFSRLKELTEAHRHELWSKYPKVQEFANTFDEIPEELLRFPEDLLRKLDDDLKGVFPGRVEWEEALKRPEGLPAYLLLNNTDAWRRNPQLIVQLSDDIADSADLKRYLSVEGDDAVQAWKIVDDELPGSLWCPLN